MMTNRAVTVAVNRIEHERGNGISYSTAKWKVYGGVAATVYAPVGWAVYEAVDRAGNEAVVLDPAHPGLSLYLNEVPR